MLAEAVIFASLTQACVLGLWITILHNWHILVTHRGLVLFVVLKWWSVMLINKPRKIDKLQWAVFLFVLKRRGDEHQNNTVMSQWTLRLMC